MTSVINHKRGAVVNKHLDLDNRSHIPVCSKMWRLIALYNPHAHSRVNALYIIESENFILSNPQRKSIQHFNKDVAFSKTCGSRSSTP